MNTKTATINAMAALDAIETHKGHDIPNRFGHMEHCELYFDAYEAYNRAMLVIANSNDDEARRVVTAYRKTL